MTVRNIRTTYFRGRDVVKKNFAVHADNAVLHSVDHLQHDSYEATHAEVFNSETGKLYSVVRRNMKGITILFKSDPESSTAQKEQNNE